jgi:hypothetical protein
MLQLPAAVTRPHEHTGGAHAPRELEVPEAVADDEGRREVDAEVARGAVEEAGARLAAVAFLPVGSVAHRRVMRAEVHSVEARAARFHLLRDPAVHLVDEGFRKVAAGHAGLVGDEDGQERAAVDEANRFHREGEQAEAGEVVDVADLFGERAVAIDEDRAAQRG